MSENEHNHHHHHRHHHRHHDKSEKEVSDFGSYQRKKNIRKRLVSILFGTLVVIAIAILAFVAWIYSQE